MNYAKTALLLAGMTGLFMALGFMMGGQGGMMFALLFAIATNVFSYWFSDRAVLRMYGAQEVSFEQAPRLYDMTAQLAANAGIPMPRLFLINDPQPNAFATGRNPDHAAVAVHSGLLDMLSEEEVAGVIAHELAHIRNYDTLIMTITATLAGAISMVGNMAMFSSHDRERGPGLIGGVLMMVLAPMAAMVVQMAISRTREYAADAAGGQICGNPLWLASGLKKIAHGTAEIPNWNAEAHPATAHMFIMNPLSKRAMDNLFTTHPDTNNRIVALIEQAQAMGIGTAAAAGGFVSGGSSGPWGARS